MGEWTPSSMDGNVAVIGWNTVPVSLGSSSWWSNLVKNSIDVVTPDFGKFGGPGYSGGHLFDSNNNCIDGSNTTIYEALNSDPARNSAGVYSQSDAAFKDHDKAYSNAGLPENQSNKSALIIQADLDLLGTLLDIFQNQNYKMDRQEIAYDLLAGVYFLEQINAMSTVADIKNAAQNLFDAITNSSTTYTIDHMTIPANPDWITQTPFTSTTIVGDFTPVDFDPDTEGIQAHYDEWGNVIIDTSKPLAGRSDTLYDTTGNDEIYGYGGDDYITASRGGDNLLYGGDGNDHISTSGTGNNRIYGGAGDDQITTDNNGEDYISGGNGNDLIDGNTSTNCIIEGGAGSDIIFGSMQAITDCSVILL